MPFNELNSEETRVIINKGTERAGIGELTDCEQVGTYVCRQCNTALYQSRANSTPAVAGQVSTTRSQER